MNHPRLPQPASSVADHGRGRMAAVLVLLLGMTGATPAFAQDGGALVAEVTKTGYDGHPYYWAPPSC